MNADDPRHGTYAGAAQHERDFNRTGINTECEPCAEARRRYQRRRPHLHTLGRPPRVPIGFAQWLKLELLRQEGFTQTEFMEAVGIAASTIDRMIKGGPGYRTSRAMRAKLHAFDPEEYTANRLTHVGMVRRVRALQRIGYSCLAIGKVAGLTDDCLEKMARGEATYSGFGTRKKIAAAYDKLHMKPLDGTHDRFISRTLNKARRNKWPPPFAWDNIDDPRERPQGMGKQPHLSKDHVNRLHEVHRLLAEGASAHGAAAELGISYDGLWKWCDREGHLDLWARMAANGTRIEEVAAS